MRSSKIITVELTFIFVGLVVGWLLLLIFLHITFLIKFHFLFLLTRPFWFPAFFSHFFFLVFSLEMIIVVVLGLSLIIILFSLIIFISGVTPRMITMPFSVPLLFFLLYLCNTLVVVSLFLVVIAQDFVSAWYSFELFLKRLLYLFRLTFTAIWMVLFSELVKVVFYVLFACCIFEF